MTSKLKKEKREGRSSEREMEKLKGSEWLRLGGIHRDAQNCEVSEQQCPRMNWSWSSPKGKRNKRQWHKRRSKEREDAVRFPSLPLGRGTWGPVSERCGGRERGTLRQNQKERRLPVALTAVQPASELYIGLYFYRPAHARCWDVCNNTQKIGKWNGETQAENSSYGAFARPLGPLCSPAGGCPSPSPPRTAVVMGGPAPDRRLPGKGCVAWPEITIYAEITELTQGSQGCHSRPPQWVDVWDRAHEVFQSHLIYMGLNMSVCSQENWFHIADDTFLCWNA